MSDPGRPTHVGPSGRAAVLGAGAVWVVRLTQAGTCQAKQPLSGVELEVAQLQAGHTLLLPSGGHSLPTTRYGITAGALERAKDAR